MFLSNQNIDYFLTIHYFQLGNFTQMQLTKMQKRYKVSSDYTGKLLLFAQTDSTIESIQTDYLVSVEYYILSSSTLI